MLKAGQGLNGGVFFGCGSLKVGYDGSLILHPPPHSFPLASAILGVQAKTVICIEDGSATELLRQLAESVGDEVEIKEFERLSPLAVADAPLASLNDLLPGDCVVSFGRQKLFDLKATIEGETGMKCALVYGALPPETRKQQARLFNDPESDFKVSVDPY